MSEDTAERRGREVGVEQIGGIPAGLQPGANLLRRQPRLLDTLPEDIGQPGVLLDGSLQRPLRLRRRWGVLGRTWPRNPKQPSENQWEQGEGSGTWRCAARRPGSK